MMHDNLKKKWLKNKNRYKLGGLTVENSLS